MRSILSLHVFLILFLISQRVTKAVVTSSRKGHRPIVSTKDPSGCAQHCDVQRCARVYPDTCEGWVEKDSCGCCPICNTSRPSVRSVISSTSAVKHDPAVCDQIRCPKRQRCYINIQGIPFCRCPSALLCSPERQAQCELNGTTYASLCHVKVAECEQKRTIDLLPVHRCSKPTVATSTSTLFSSSAMRPSAGETRRQRRRRRKFIARQRTQEVARQRQVAQKMRDYERRAKTKTHKKENGSTRKHLADRQSNKLHSG